jgi:hypothetical protein
MMEYFESHSLMRSPTKKEIHHEVFHELTLAHRTKNGEFCHAGMDCRHPGSHDASGDIPVSSHSMPE